MARPMGPRFKVARHLGINVFNHPKALKRGIKIQKLSEYGKQLIEKQKLKAYYDVLEKQFKRYVNEAFKSNENSAEVLVQNLECRLDNLVYRLGFGSTLRQSRQMVVHGHILVGGRRIDRPSYRVRVGETISLIEKSRKNEMFYTNFNSSDLYVSYLEKDFDSFTGSLLRKPHREEVPIEVKDSSILEFYSKN